MTQPMPPQSIMEFLGADHTNELVSTHKHAKDLDFLNRIDGLLMSPVKLLDVPQHLHPLVQLYSFVHYQLYATVSNLMRLHLGEALGCQRKAIDATFSAYLMLLDANTVPEYQARHRKFLNIKAHIVHARKADPGSFPLAEELLKTWDHCSEFGAHADDSGFALRVGAQPVPDAPGKHTLFFFYFQQPASLTESSWYYVDAFVNFLAMARIFEPFIRDHAKGFPCDEWMNRLNGLDGAARNEWARLRDLFDKEQTGPTNGSQ